MPELLCISATVLESQQESIALDNRVVLVIMGALEEMI